MTPLQRLTEETGAAHKPFAEAVQLERDRHIVEHERNDQNFHSIDQPTLNIRCTCVRIHRVLQAGGIKARECAIVGCSQESWSIIGEFDKTFSSTQRLNARDSQSISLQSMHH